MVAEMHLLEQVCIVFLNRFPTVNRPIWSQKNRVLCVERGKRVVVVFVFASSILLLNSSTCWRSCALGVGSSCWAKVGKAQLIADPTRAITKRIRIVSSRCFRTVVAEETRCAIEACEQVHSARLHRYRRFLGSEDERLYCPLASVCALPIENVVVNT
jgi:hypothetical protein